MITDAQLLYKVSRGDISKCLESLVKVNADTLPNIYTARKNPDLVPRSLSVALSPRIIPCDAHTTAERKPCIAHIVYWTGGKM